MSLVLFQDRPRGCFVEYSSPCYSPAADYNLAFSFRLLRSARCRQEWPLAPLEGCLRASLPPGCVVTLYPGVVILRHGSAWFGEGGPPHQPTSTRLQPCWLETVGSFGRMRWAGRALGADCDSGAGAAKPWERADASSPLLSAPHPCFCPRGICLGISLFVASMHLVVVGCWPPGAPMEHSLSDPLCFTASPCRCALLFSIESLWWLLLHLSRDLLGTSAVTHFPARSPYRPSTFRLPSPNPPY